MAENKKIRIVTHSGTFHVDDLFGVAALQLLHGVENTEVVRSRDPDVWATGDYVVDVGDVYDHLRKRYDHHQKGGAGARKNGVPYSGFGLIWKHYGEEIAGSKKVMEKIDREMVTPIDLADNGIDVYAAIIEGVHPYLIHRVLVAMRPTWKEGDKFDERFGELLVFAREILSREIITARDVIEGEEYVREAVTKAEDPRIVILEKPYPWHEVLAKTPGVFYVVKPKAQGGNWEVECVRDDVHSFLNRRPLPEAWRGYRDQKLVEVTGVPDAVFCHNTGFIAVTSSRDGALALAKKALEN